MTAEPRLTIGRSVAVLAAAILLLTGAGVTFLLMRDGPGSSNEPTTRPTEPAPAAVPSTVPTSARTVRPSDGPLPDISVPLTRDALERAGIVVAPVATASTSGEFRVPGVVEPNAYRQVAVTPLVAGRVTRVSAALGDHVRRGQSIAQIYSPELAEAQTRYVGARAMLDAHDRELQRTEKLVEIGAASRQELERIHAEHAAQTATVQSARSQLELLGLSTSAIDTLPSGSVSTNADVPAPIDGVVTERSANVGVNVDSTSKLFTIVDLSTVWIVADVYEKDFSRIRVGTQATISTSAYPELALSGRVNYIDPQVNAATRTAKVRVEVPNANARLRFGMYADVVVREEASAEAPVLPQSAVQNVGDRTVVYLAKQSEPGVFVEREVRLGDTSGSRVQVQSGVQPGDMVVTDGSFFLRAERERLGLRPSKTPSQAARVVVSEQGFEPAKVTLRAGTAARITFIRTTDKTCATEVVFPSLSIKRTLPLNEAVDVEFTPAKAGEIAFACGMNMLKGVVVVQ
jgi:RND family efflux transporter MFP subunit